MIQENFRPAVPNNKIYWQNFEGEKQIADHHTEDTLSFQEEISPFNNVNLLFKEPELISEASIVLEKK